MKTKLNLDLCRDAFNNHPLKDESLRDEFEIMCVLLLDNRPPSGHPSIAQRNVIILCMRYGFDGNGTKTYGEIAKLMGMTKEPIRQIIERQLRWLGHGPRIRYLKRYVSEKVQCP